MLLPLNLVAPDKVKYKKAKRKIPIATVIASLERAWNCSAFKFY
jgi:hypothetical protein